MGEFDQTIGFTLLGVTINTYLTGVIMSQFFTYWTSKYRDPWWTRSLVAFLFIVNTTQAAAVIYMSWFSLWPYPFTALTTAVLALVNQAFQSWRIYIFTKSKILVALLLVTALATCGIGVAAAIESWIFSELAKLVALQPIVEANLALQCAVDVLIATIMSVMFSRSRTSFAKTDRVINRLIRTAAQSGFFTAVFALGTLLSFRFSPGTYMIALFALPIGRIYTHTMMDHFISRDQLRGMLSNGSNIISVPNFNLAQTTATPTGGGTEVIIMHDTSTSSTSKDRSSSSGKEPQVF
ncbi:hypothetical protein C8R43DRAFT_994143 [Mycena crocata]|nr:hypothetical protein C8R43DRAFT_994143 [Mycena crocata]